MHVHEYFSRGIFSCFLAVFPVVLVITIDNQLLTFHRNSISLYKCIYYIHTDEIPRIFQ